MAKITFSKLGLKKNTDVEIIKWNDQEIEVKKYLPIEEKLTLVSNVLNQSIDENSYYNVARVHLFTILEMIYAYTNISFTDKQKEDVFKLYDLLISSGLWSAVSAAIDPPERDTLNKWIEQMIHNIYEYRRSALGILEAIQTDYSELNLDSEQIRENLSNPENLQLLRDTLTKLG